MTVSLKPERNDLQGLLSLISIQAKKIDKDHLLADRSLCDLFFFSLQKPRSIISPGKRPRCFQLHLYLYLDVDGYTVYPVQSVLTHY